MLEIVLQFSASKTCAVQAESSDAYLELCLFGWYVIVTKQIYCRKSLVRRVRSLAFTTKHPFSAQQTQAMSVLLETSLGDITIDLLVDDAPRCCEK